MKKKLNSQTAFFNPRFALAVFLYLTGGFIALGGAGFSPARSAIRVELPRLGPPDMVTTAAGAPRSPLKQPLSPADAPFTFNNTGSLDTARYFHTATLLPNGKVLVAGGLGNSGSLTSAELYDPASGSWTATGSLNTARFITRRRCCPTARCWWQEDMHMARRSYQRGTVRPGERELDGHGQPQHRALLCTRRRCCPTARCSWQGDMVTVAILRSAELYDPASGSWTATGSLNTARYCAHGDVAAQRQGAGGRGRYWYSAICLRSAELYDPASGSWTATGSLNTARDFHTATLLPNGKVLVAGGVDNSGYSYASAELYDPASGSWTVTGSLNTARDNHTATLLPNGKVLVAGGVIIAAALLPARNCTTRRAGAGRPRAASTPHADCTRRRCCPTARCWWQGDMITATLLASAELYDPASGSWTATGSLNTARVGHTATLLPNGKVLVAGGI